MALKAEQGVIAAHPKAVVCHPNQAPPPGLYVHADALALRVEGVLDEFLYDAGRAFNDLAGCNLVRDLFGEQSDAVHGQVTASPSLLLLLLLIIIILLLLLIPLTT